MTDRFRIGDAMKSRRAVIAVGAALALGAIGVASAQQAKVTPTPTVEPTPRVALVHEAHVDGPVVRVEIKGPGDIAELRERHDKLIEKVAEKLGVTPERLRDAFAESSKELGLPGDGLLPVPALTPIGSLRGEGALLVPAARPNGVAGADHLVLAVRSDSGKESFRIEVSTNSEVAARALGISVEQLQQELADKSLAEVAKAHGVEPSAVADALKVEAHAKIDQARADGRIAQEKADRLKRDIATAIDRMVNRADRLVPALKAL